MKKLNSFIALTMAILTGDDNKAIAAKNWRKADSAFQSHISNLEGQTVDLEDKLQDAQEKFEKALVNYGKPIENRTVYMDAIIRAKNAVTEAQENLDNHMQNLADLREIHTNLSVDSMNPEKAN